MSVNVFVSDASRDWARSLDDTIERWRIRHEIQTPSQQILAMSLDELREYMHTLDYQQLFDLKVELDVLGNAIKSQLGLSYAKGYPNRQWVASASKVKNICSSYSQAIQVEMGSRPKPPKRSRPKSLILPQYFMHVAEEMLDPELFGRIREEAQRRAWVEGE